MQIKDELVLNDFRGLRRCEWCEWFRQCDPHHILHKNMGGGGRLDVRINLLALCRLCHTKHHDGNPPTREDCLAIVAAREGLLQCDILNELWRLRRADKNETASYGPGQALDRHHRRQRQGAGDQPRLRADLPQPLPGSHARLAPNEDGRF